MRRLPGRRRLRNCETGQVAAHLRARIEITKIREKFPDAIQAIDEFRGDSRITVPREQIVEILTLLRDDPELQYNFFSETGQGKALADKLVAMKQANPALKIRIFIEADHGPSAARNQLTMQKQLTNAVKAFERGEEAAKAAKTERAIEGAEGAAAPTTRPGWNEPWTPPPNWNGPVNHGEFFFAGLIGRATHCM